MLWISGFLGFLQITLIPGAVLLLYSGRKGLNAIEQIVAAFTTSLVLNYGLVATFALLHIHSRLTWSLVIAAELVLLILRLRQSPRFWNVDLQSIGKLRDASAGTTFAGIFFLASLLVAAGIFVQNWGTVYVSNDDVASWDRWAMETAQNQLPKQTGLYPQLLPANGSIPYVLMGNTDVKLFSKAVTPLYSLAILLLFLSLAVRRKSAAYLLGGTFFLLMALHYLPLHFLTWGYADMPLAFFGFLTLYCMYRCSGGSDRDSLIAALTVGTVCVLVKQEGIYVTAAISLYATFWTLREARRAKRERRSPTRLLQKDGWTACLAVVVLFCIAWYGYKAYQLHRGTESSNLALLTQGLHQGRSYVDRLQFTWELFLRHWPRSGKDFTWTSAVLLVAGLALRQTRWLTALVIMPFLLAYGVFFSYEIRNVALAFPSIALVCGETMHAVFRGAGELLKKLRTPASTGVPVALLLAGAAISALPRFRHRFPGLDITHFAWDDWLVETWLEYGPYVLSVSLAYLILRMVKVRRGGAIVVGPILLGLLIAFFGWNAMTNPDSKVMAQQVAEGRRTIGDPEVADRLYRLFEQNRLRSPVVTNYWYLAALPQIKPLFRGADCFAGCTPGALDSMALRNPEAGYLLMTESTLAPETFAFLDHSRRFTTIFSVNNQRLLQIDRTVIIAARSDGRAAIRSVTPLSGAGREAQFEFSFCEPQGPRDTPHVAVIMNSSLRGDHACYFEWHRNRNTVSIANDNGVGFAAEGKPGSAAVLSNAQCTLDLSRWSVRESSGELRLSAAVRFSSTFRGPRRFFSSPLGDKGNVEGFRELGAWVVK